MNAWQYELMGSEVDAMWEADAARQWEELNAPDPYEKALKEAAKEMNEVLKGIDGAISNLADASAELYETPMQAKVDSFIETLDDIRFDLTKMQERWERGERE